MPSTARTYAALRGVAVLPYKQGSGRAEECEPFRTYRMVPGGGSRRARQLTVPTEAFTGLDGRPRDARDEPTLAQSAEVFGGEVHLRRTEFDGPAPSWSPSPSSTASCSEHHRPTSVP